VRISIVTPGDTRTAYLREGEGDFLGRLNRYAPARIVPVRETRVPPKLPAEAVREREWKELSAAIPARCHRVALDRRGRMLSSEDLAERIRELQNRSVEEACFVIGGPSGLCDAAVRSSDFVLSLSPMTFTHEMTRLILLEQLYRAFTILGHEKYHK
jgi:23S rRNA (pseudouridine1915-N3)-methyltransferase